MPDLKNPGRRNYILKGSLICCFLIVFLGSLYAQKIQAPKTGDPSPNFKLKDIECFDKRTASLADFRGKWLLLNFWTSDCVSCVEAIPRLNKLNQKFKDSLQILLVGRDHLINGTGTKRAHWIYNRVRSRIALTLPIAYDTVLFRQFSVPGPGYAIWIDDKGIIRALTGTELITEDNVNGMISGELRSLAEMPNMENKTKNEGNFDFRKPLLTNGNGGNDTSFYYRSMLTPFTPNMEQLIIDFKKESHWPDYLKNGIQFFGVNLNMLYSLAYHGTSSFRPGDGYYEKYWPNVILETRDSLSFASDFTTGFHFYCYSVIVPKEKATTEYLQAAMKDDLRRYFGYAVRLENRKMPCWNLVCIDSCQHLLTKGGSPTNDDNQGTLDAGGFRIQNQPVNALIERIFNYQEYLPIIDRTNITGNIDITLNALLADMNQIRYGLQKNGLDLVKGETEMNVIVISDN